MKEVMGATAAGEHGTSRGSFLASVGAVGAVSMLPSGPVLAQGGAKPTVIDTHHHFYAPAYQKAWLDWEDQRKIPHFTSQVDWSPAKSLEEMDKNGVRRSVLRSEERRGGEESRARGSPYH